MNDPQADPLIVYVLFEEIDGGSDFGIWGVASSKEVAAKWVEQYFKEIQNGELVDKVLPDDRTTYSELPVEEFRKYGDLAVAGWSSHISVFIIYEFQVDKQAQ